MNAVPLLSTEGLPILPDPSTEVGQNVPRAPEADERNEVSRLQALCKELEERVQLLSTGQHQTDLQNMQTKLAKIQSRRVWSYLENEDAYRANIAELEGYQQINLALILNQQRQLQQANFNQTVFLSEINRLNQRHESDSAQIEQLRSMTGPINLNEQAFATLSREQLITLCAQHRTLNDRLRARITEMDSSLRTLQNELDKKSKAINDLHRSFEFGQRPKRMRIRLLDPVVNQEVASRLKVNESEVRDALNSLAADQEKPMASAIGIPNLSVERELRGSAVGPQSWDAAQENSTPVNAGSIPYTQLRANPQLQPPGAAQAEAMAVSAGSISTSYLPAVTGTRINPIVLTDAEAAQAGDMVT